jgi:hypothetical protein
LENETENIKQYIRWMKQGWMQQEEQLKERLNRDGTTEMEHRRTEMEHRRDGTTTGAIVNTTKSACPRGRYPKQSMIGQLVPKPRESCGSNNKANQEMNHRITEQRAQVNRQLQDMNQRLTDQQIRFDGLRDQIITTQNQNIATNQFAQSLHNRIVHQQGLIDAILALQPLNQHIQQQAALGGNQ